MPLYPCEAGMLTILNPATPTWTRRSNIFSTVRLYIGFLSLLYELIRASVRHRGT